MNSKGLTDFSASAGWLYHFRKRHSTQDKKISGERLDVPVEETEPVKKHLQALIHETEQCPYLLYSSDVMGLY